MGSNMGILHRGAIAAMGFSIIFAGCASDPNQQVWTTKNQSMLTVRTDTPSLSLGDAPVPSGPAVSAAELRQPALSILLQAADSPSSLLRANAIEALSAAPETLEPIVQRGLADENRGVRFVSAMSVGKHKFINLAPLLEPLLHDESQSVQAAAMYGLRRCGRPIDLNPLLTMLLADDAEVKGNAALVLGELGDKSAIAVLRSSIGKGLHRATQARRKIVELQIVEAMVKLGATHDLEVIRAALFVPDEEAELAALACQMCGELKDGSAVPDLSNLIHRTGKWERPAEIRMTAAMAIARINPSRILVEVPAGYANSNRPELRAQAAHTMGVMGGNGKQMLVALSHLSRLLADANPLVQVAAAGSVLRLEASSAG